MIEEINKSVNSVYHVLCFPLLFPSFPPQGCCIDALRIFQVFFASSESKHIGALIKRRNRCRGASADGCMLAAPESF